MWKSNLFCVVNVLSISYKDIVCLGTKLISLLTIALCTLRIVNCQLSICALRISLLFLHRGIRGSGGRCL